ncbi:hypothetical protein CCE28_18830 [Anaeromicrobium sediminis]|uniref:Uncharacterized protein n=1 Tax=Anaeromicrobium sediminis TaxID=1478221 RepID=A0A267MF69_9FIRM|nr:hypothetical protein CCE28_18830 [Anaeromicrobium sediminis]
MWKAYNTNMFIFLHCNRCYQENEEMFCLKPYVKMRKKLKKSNKQNISREIYMNPQNNSML